MIGAPMMAAKCFSMHTALFPFIDEPGKEYNFTGTLPTEIGLMTALTELIIGK